MSIVHTEACWDHLNAVVTVTEAAFMYRVSQRYVNEWCMTGVVCCRQTYSGSWLISLDDLLMKKGDPRRWLPGQEDTRND